MDVIDEITKLLEAKQGTEDSVARRSFHIKWIWLCIVFIMTTGIGWLVLGTLWYAKMERISRAVEQLYSSYFGHSLP